ncbi:glutathione S-transferase family protein [Shumkonia mesophila]|uniref:glutathione S-transferase family protein n=1 Tax=Shumkonia mesophila TaxID=2838854 RepID=UPI0029342436|nr:glutathione S-transferase family protein [Shumkonia mesophila]
MSLTLHYHPLASFCHKVLIALYEAQTPFTAHVVDLMDGGARAHFLDLWPVGKIPVLRDEARDATVPETTIIIEYLDRHYPGPRPLLPADEDARLETRLWDRFFDAYVHAPMQAVVGDRLRPEEARDPTGIAAARATLATAYGMIEKRMAERTWAVGEDFSLADCAAAPALFYAGIVAPFPAGHALLAAYFERLLARPSFARVLTEARPYFAMFPFKDDMPARFLEGGAPGR